MLLVFCNGCSNNVLEPIHSEKIKVKKEKDYRTLSLNKVEWIKDRVLVESCLKGNENSVSDLKRKLIKQAQSDAIESYHINMESAFYSEDVCKINQDETCKSFITSTIKTFSEGLIKESSYTFKTKNDISCIKFSALVELPPVSLTYERRDKIQISQITKDYSTAVTDPSILYLMGLKFSLNNNDSKAIFYLKKSLKYGNNKAALILSIIYDKLDDYRQALFYAKKAADLGNIKAAFYVGFLYQNTAEIRNYKKAYFWLQKAKKKNYNLATVSIAQLAINGYIDTDQIKALNDLIKVLESKETMETEVLARKTSLQILGRAYLEGIILKKDFKTALCYLKIAADDYNSAYAQSQLGKIYMLGMEGQKDYTQALYYLQKAVENGVIEAYNDLALMYCFGNGVKVNMPTCAKLTKYSIDKNYYPANKVWNYFKLWKYIEI